MGRLKPQNANELTDMRALDNSEAGCKQQEWAFFEFPQQNELWSPDNLSDANKNRGMGMTHVDATPSFQQPVR